MKEKISDYISSFAVIIILFTLAGSVGEGGGGVYDCLVPIEVYNNGSSTHYNLTVLVPINSSQLAALGYMDADGLDTDVTEGATGKTYAVFSNKLPVFADVFATSQRRDYTYYMGSDVDQTGFPIMVGHGGYMTVLNASSIRPAADVEVGVEGFIDTGSGDCKYIFTKPSSIDLVVESTGVLNATVSHRGNATYVSSISVDGDGSLGNLSYSGEATAWESIEVGSGTSSYLNGSTASVVLSSFTLEDIDALPCSAEIINATVWTNQQNPVANNNSISIPGFYLNGEYQYGDPYSQDQGADTGVWYNTTREVGRPGGGQWLKEDLENVELVMGLSIDGEGATHLSEVYVTVWYYPRLADASVTGSAGTGLHTVSVTYDGAELELIIDGVSVGTDAFVGTINDYDTDYVFYRQDSVPYATASYINKSAAKKGWWEPVLLVDATAVPDRSGNGNPGVITWGENPDGFEIDIGPITCGESTTAEGGEEGELGEGIFKIPDQNTWTPPAEDELSGLPMYDIFAKAADYLGWSTRVLYATMMLITCIAMAFAATIALGSSLAGILTFGLFAGMAASTVVIPWWISVMTLLFAGFGLYMYLKN